VNIDLLINIQIRIHEKGSNVCTSHHYHRGRVSSDLLPLFCLLLDSEIGLDVD